ncbi:MAG: response regulator transcription factor [Chloroflexi bacterium]|nr:response regulator transcription factor [Chloroflexota bacterium]
MGFACLVAPYGEDTVNQVAEQTPALVLLAIDARFGIPELSRKLKQEKQLPIIALVDGEMLDIIEATPDIDDFILQPGNVQELALRIKRMLPKTKQRDASELISCDDLVIDLANCEVTLADKRVTLTFKEYELLKFLASNRGRVFTREALLNKVWGYDYYGGDRTVDVHIRRLRSKTEDATHTFIETVRNIGYRFK